MPENRQPAEDLEGSADRLPEPAVRLAVAADAKRLLDLQKALDEQSSYMLLEPGERRTTVGELAATLAGCGPDEGTYFLVADDGRSLAGYVNVEVMEYARACRTGYLVIGVDGRSAGRGIGRALMRAAVAEGRRRGLRRIELTVMTSNQPAIRLYLSEGFQVEGLRRSCLSVAGQTVDEYYLGLILAEVTG